MTAYEERTDRALADRERDEAREEAIRQKMLDLFVEGCRREYSAPPWPEFSAGGFIDECDVQSRMDLVEKILIAAHAPTDDPKQTVAEAVDALVRHVREYALEHNTALRRKAEAIINEYDAP